MFMGALAFAFGAGIMPVACLGQEAGWFEEPPAPGQHIGLEAEDLQHVSSFRADQPVVGTYLFYWYDVYSTAHLTYGDGGDACTTHPPSWEDYSYHSTRWWVDQLRDITAAGIDFAAPVYWGYPGCTTWSFDGLPHLARALDYMDRTGETYPKVALFYDTSTLRSNEAHVHIDLSTEEGKAWFYCTIRDFFSFIPPKHWAAIDGRPIVLLYSPSFAKKQDPAVFPYVRGRFLEDFKVDPYIIKQSSWQGEADNTCEWGGALGLSMAGCAALGPGYDHSAVRGRTPLVRDREDGAFYSRSWETLLRFNPTRRPRLVMVETWNEFHEGTDVAHSAEYGRQYVELTRKYTDMFHANLRSSALAGPYSEAKSVSVAFKEGGQQGGIAIRSAGDGIVKETTLAGRACVQTAPSEHPSRFVYLDLDDSFAFDLDEQSVRVTVEYLDQESGAFELHYDSNDPEGSVRDGAFKPGGRVDMQGTGEWKTARFVVKDGRFANRANGSDLRLAVLGGGNLAVTRVDVTKE